MDFDSFVAELQEIGVRHSSQTSGELLKEATRAESLFRSLPAIDRNSVAELVRTDPWIVPYLASCAGLGLEQLRRQLQSKLGTTGWIVLGRKEPLKIVDALDEPFEVVEALAEQLDKQWTFADVLVERITTSSRRASRSQDRGRLLEDEVENILKRLGLTYEMRTQFVGRGASAPCDFAVPAGGEKAKIVGSVKGFDSTGSKLSDAVREIQAVADVRRPHQFVFAVVDGIGWLGRKADLKRIFTLRENDSIDGLYSLARMPELQRDMAEAAKRLGLI